MGTVDGVLRKRNDSRRPTIPKFAVDRFAVPGFAAVASGLNRLGALAWETTAPYRVTGAVERVVDTAISERVSEKVRVLSRAVGRDVGADIQGHPIDPARLGWMADLREDALRRAAADLLFWGTLYRPVGTGGRMATRRWMAEILTGAVMRDFSRLVEAEIAFSAPCPVCGSEAAWKYSRTPVTPKQPVLDVDCSRHRLNRTHNGDTYTLSGFDLASREKGALLAALDDLERGVDTLSTEGTEWWERVRERACALALSGIPQACAKVRGNPSQSVAKLMEYMLAVAAEGHSDLLYEARIAANDMLLEMVEAPADEALLRLAAAGSIEPVGTGMQRGWEPVEATLSGPIMHMSSGKSDWVGVARELMATTVGDLELHYSPRSFSFQTGGPDRGWVRLTRFNAAELDLVGLGFEWGCQGVEVGDANVDPVVAWRLNPAAATLATSSTPVAEVGEEPTGEVADSKDEDSATPEMPKIYVLINRAHRWEGADGLSRPLPKIGTTARTADTRGYELGRPTGVPERYEVYWEQAHPEAKEIERRFKRRHSDLLTVGSTGAKKEHVRMLPAVAVAQLCAIMIELEAEREFVAGQKARLRHLFEVTI